MACSTSGTRASTSRSSARSRSRERARPIDGSFIACISTSPSSIVGMKVLPVPK
jgi:hypothetical protein